MDAYTENTIETLPPPPMSEDDVTDTVGWGDVVAASEANERASKEPDAVYEYIDVPIDDAALAKIAMANAEDAATIETLEDDIKEIRARIKPITLRIAGRNEGILSGTHNVRARRVDLFETNTIQYLDPESGKVLDERAMGAEDRQLELPLDGQAADADSSHEIFDSDYPDSTTNLGEDGPDSEGINALDVLSAADKPVTPAESEPPSRPVKRKKKNGAA